MATATGYQGYGSPERAKVERERRLAELLQQGVTDTGPKSLWEGVAQLGKAFIARDAMGRADKAEGEYGDSQRRAFDLLSSQMFPDSTAGTASVSQAPTPGDAKARLMAKANPEGTAPHAAMAAPATAAAPAPSADPNAITKTDLPPLPQASPGVAAIAEALSRQGGPVSPYMQEYAQPGQPAPAAPPMAQPAPQMQPQAAPQAGMNPTARIAGALMAQPPMQKPPMQPQGQQGQASPENIRAVMMQYGQLTGDWAGALELGKSMQPAAPELQALQGPDGAISVFDQRSGTVKQIQPGTPKPADPVKWETEMDASGNMVQVNPYTGEKRPLGMRGRVPGSDNGSQRDKFRPATPQEASLYGYDSGQINEADGRFYPGPAPATGGQTTEGERAAGLHAGISINGLQNLQEMESGGYNRAGVSEQAGGLLGGENERLYDQAADEFIDGYLRAMTGAAATPAEIAQYRRQWFPSFGDSPPVVQQKAEGRLNAIKQMKSKTGRSWNPEWDAIIVELERQVGGQPQPQPTSGAPDFENPTPPSGLPPQLQQAWKMGNPRTRQMAWGTLAPNQQAFAMGGQGAQQQAPAPPPPPAAADLGDDELRAMLGL